MVVLTDQQTAEYKEAFMLFDKDGDGCITTFELGNVIRALGKSPTETELKAVVKSIDPDNRGVVDFPEFLTVMSGPLRNFDDKTALRKAWDVMDKDKVSVVGVVPWCADPKLDIPS